MAAVLKFLFFILFLSPKICFAETIIITPLTIQEALSNYGPKSVPFKENTYFLKQQAFATKAGINLWNHLNEKFVSGTQDNKLYSLFYNHVSAPHCGKQYLIQKANLEKTYIKGNKAVMVQNEYLVEVFKLNQLKSTIKSDQHSRNYTLQEYDARQIVLNIEVGCGEIPGVVEGNTWPYDPQKIYYLLQDYSADPGHYNAVNFSDSRKYRLEVYFSRGNPARITLPDFLN